MRSARNGCRLLALLAVAAQARAGDDRAAMLAAGKWHGTVTAGMTGTVSTAEQGFSVTLTLRRSITYVLFLEGVVAAAAVPGGARAAGWAASPAWSRLTVKVTDRRVERSEGGNSYSRTLTTDVAGPIRPFRLVTLGIDAAAGRYKLHLDGDSFDEKEVTEETNEGSRTKVITNGRSTPTLELEDLALPASGAVLSGSRTVVLQNEVEDWRDLAPRVKYTVTWNLAPGEPDCEFLRREIEKVRKDLDARKPGAEASRRAILDGDGPALASLAGAAAQGRIPPGMDAIAAASIQQEMAALPLVRGADGEAYFRSLGGYLNGNPMPLPFPAELISVPGLVAGQDLRSRLAAAGFDGQISLALLDALREELERCAAGK